MIKLCKPYIDGNEINLAGEVIKSGWITHGPYNKKFEKMFSEKIGVNYAIACNSCTSALFLAIKALNITGEVIIPSFSFVATANAIVTAGAIPKFVDIEYDTCNINPEKIREAINSKTQAIIPVHFAGQCCDMSEIVKIAEENKLYIIEDSAETIGGTHNGKQAGSFGIGCFSFFPTKNITTGEGGMITTNNEKLAKEIKALIGHGIDSTTYEREKKEMPWFRSAIKPGYNFRMSNILAAIGVEQMKKLDYMNNKRIEHSEYLIEGLKDNKFIDLPFQKKNNKHVFQMFTIKVDKSINRNNIVKKLNEDGIEASVHFYPPIHLQGFYKDHSEWINSSLEITEDIANRIITLPMYPSLKKEELDKIIERVNYFIS